MQFHPNLPKWKTIYLCTMLNFTDPNSTTCSEQGLIMSGINQAVNSAIAGQPRLFTILAKCLNVHTSIPHSQNS